MQNILTTLFLKAYATNADLEKLCTEAKTIGAAMVAINTEWTKFCKEQLQGTDVHVGAAIGFPLGQCGLDTNYLNANGPLNRALMKLIM